MNPIITTYDGYQIGSHMELDTDQLTQIMALFKRPPASRLSPLEGRSPVNRGNIKNIGPVVIKTYTRGGLINLFTKYSYLRTGKPRCQKEYEMMAAVDRFGVSVPEPIAFAYLGRVSYKCWLAVREVNDSLNLAQLCSKDQGRCRKAVAKLTEQVRILVDRKVLHVDLHPGNVLIDRKDHIYIVDFDRATIKNWSERRMYDYYRTRWARAVDKHKLPSLLRDEMDTRLSFIDR